MRNGRTNETAVEMPFSVSRTVGATLISQVEEGIRNAIERGEYKPGDCLPTTREIAKSLGVGRVVVEQALSRLKKRSYVSARPHVGIVVLDAGVKLWRGNVLVVTTSHSGSYYPNVFAGEVKTHLLEAGYLCMQVSADSFSPMRVDLSALKAYLRGPVDLAVVLFHSPNVEKCLSRAQVPFIVIADRRPSDSRCCGCVRLDWSFGVSDFVRHCQERKVKSVMQMSVRDHETALIREELEKAGIPCECLRVRVTKSASRLPNAERMAFAAMKRRLKNIEKIQLPELIFFSDDHLATGALWALTSAGLKVPDDVKVVSWANGGNEPAYLGTLTLMRMDPYAHGKCVADLVLRRLERGDFPDGCILGPEYVKGQSFQ